MGRVEANTESDNPKMIDPAVSPYAPKFLPPQSPLSVGVPWSTGLFDCHEDQTNGKHYLLS